MTKTLEKPSPKLTRATFAKVFDAAYARLTAEQKTAVETIEGPVMVVAGPGTGKTQVLSLRVANILKRTQMRPSNILCLTFSTSGATAMRKRLKEIIGPDAYGVTINTIHGFCNDIIGQHPTVFEEWSALTQITDVERYREVNRIIDGLMPGLSLVSPKNPHGQTKNILSRMSQLKREGVTDREKLLSIADEYDAVMATKSREGTKAHERNLLQAKKFRDFLQIFFQYQESLKSTGRYDYEDMILNVIEALRQEEWLLAGLQEKYQYVLVDEFQDTNGAQFQFLKTLTENPVGEPNFFVVGDDDQAIYRFQGANLTNILSFKDRFPDAPVIALTTSFRCTQPILDAAGTLIANNTERLVGKIEGLTKDLKAFTEEKGSEPQLLLTASDAAEPFVIADLIEKRLKEGLPADEIAVLTQTNRELPILYDVLKSRGLPVELTGKLDLLSHHLVEEVIAIIRCIADPTKSAAFADALSCSCFGCHPADLGQLFSWRRDEEKSLFDVLLTLDTGRDVNSLRDTVALLRARDVLLDLHHKLPLRTVLQTLEAIYDECHLLSSHKKGEMDIIDFAALQEFFYRLKQRSYEQENFSFHELLSDLDYYAHPDYSDLRLTYDLPHLQTDGVKLMTAHKSKGLEFHTVIISSFREGHWDSRRNPPSMSVPEDLLFGWEKETRKIEKNQDERRVTFVAYTRAKRELLLTCPSSLTTGESMKSVSPSAFHAESGLLEEVTQDVKDPAQMTTLLGPTPRKLDSEFESFLRHRLENFALSPTSLQHFLEDPDSFLEIDLLQRPRAKEPVFAYGNAVHHALAHWALAVQSGKTVDQEEFFGVFTTHMSEREVLTDKEREQFLHLGERTLKRYFEEHLQSPYPIVHKVEYGINAQLGDSATSFGAGIPIKGKLDRIDLFEITSSFARVTDFKTGKPKTPKQIEDYGYRRQLVFYALLIENGYSLIDPQEFVLEFVGEQEEGPQRRVFEVTSGEKEELRTLISDVWTKVQNLDFTPL